MMQNTISGIPMNNDLFVGYIHSLVNRFFKILPIRESENKYLCTYMESLQCELIGAQAFIITIQNDPSFVSLIGILQYLIDHPEVPVATVKREVFRAISICNKLGERYSSGSIEMEVLSE